MRTNSMKKMMSLLLCVVLVAAMALTGCGNNAESAETTTAVETTAAVTEATEAVESTEAEDAAEVTVLGEGAVAFNFVVADLEGVETRYEIHSDKKTVGEALMDNELVAGTVGEWGLMVETVNGLTLDFNKDGMYWAFYIDGEYAQTGVDSTDIVEGATYSFVPSK